MRSIAAACTTALFALALPLAAVAAVHVTIPGGTTVPIRMVDTVDSGNANVGDTFQFKADDNVVVNGYIVIARGAPGHGTVTSVDRAGAHGHSGSLGIRLDYIYAVDGEKIRLDSTKKNGQQNSGASSTATIASTLLLGPVGLFAHNWVHGKNVVLDPSKALSAFVSDTVHVVSTQKAAAGGNDGFAH